MKSKRSGEWELYEGRFGHVVDWHDAKTFAERVYWALRHANIHPKTVPERSGGAISKPSIYQQLDADKTRPPQFETVHKLAQLTNVDIVWLGSGVGKPRRYTDPGAPSQWPNREICIDAARALRLLPERALDVLAVTPGPANGDPAPDPDPEWWLARGQQIEAELRAKDRSGR